MKLAVAVHGRFYAFDFVKAMLARGHEVKLFTNYPRLITRRFGLPEDAVESFPLHAVLSRFNEKVARHARILDHSPALHRLFARWAASRLSESRWQVVKIFSGVAQETLTAMRSHPGVILVRASAHIAVQNQILAEEERRSGVVIDRPRSWMVAREEREYELAPNILTLSSFALRSFLDKGFPRHKMMLLPLGVDVRAFRPSAHANAERRRRILAGEPLRVLTVGTMSMQKGLVDYAAILSELDREAFQFRFVGDVAPEAKDICRQLGNRLETIPRQPQAELPKWYEWADLFLFPTIQDGFAVVLSQARAAGLPVLTTTNCSGPDLIANEQSGWVLPVRSPSQFIERLRWCERNRGQLADLIAGAENEFRCRDWNDVAADFEGLCSQLEANHAVTAH